MTGREHADSNADQPVRTLPEQCTRIPCRLTLPRSTLRVQSLQEGKGAGTMTRKERANTARESTRTTSPWRFLVAAVGALALAAAFLTFGATSASADTAPTCPATTTVDNVTTTWALVGNDCVATVTTTANPTAVDRQLPR